MPAVIIPALLRPLAGGASRVEAEGTTLREVLNDLERQHPGILERVLDGGRVRDELFIAVGGEEVKSLNVAVPPGAEVHLLPAVAGG